jgi:hypothetical protein
VGIGGNSQVLQLNVSRLPLPMQPPAAASAGDNPSAAAPWSDVRTVVYRLVKSEDLQPSDAATSGREPQCGLLRGEWERATYVWAIQQGQAADLGRAMKVLAPEVAMIEFTYLDDTTTYAQWDSRQQGRLPTAVKIALTIRPPQRPSPQPSATPARGVSPTATVYETLVYLPNVRATLQSPPAETSQQPAATSTSPASQPAKSSIKEIKPITPISGSSGS